MTINVVNRRVIYTQALASGVVGTTPVAVDAAGTFAVSTNGVPVTSFNFTGLTVGAGLTHSALILCIGFDNQAVSGVTAVWDSGGGSPQSMTQIGTDVNTPAGSGKAQIWGLINPNPGNKTLTVGTWTTACQVCMDAISFQNVLQTGGASSFAPFSNTGSSGSATVTVTGSSNDYTVAQWVDGTGTGMSAVSDTQLYRFTSGSVIDFAANYAAQTGSKILTATTPNAWATAAVNVVAG